MNAIPPASTWTRWLAAYALAVLVMGALDALWLGVLAIDFYRRELGPLMAATVRVGPAAAYYFGYPAALIALALTPLPASLPRAALRSALLGLTAFGVYDLTNLATLRGYSSAMTVVDMAWGTCASAFGGAIVYAAVLARRP